MGDALPETVLRQNLEAARLRADMSSADILLRANAAINAAECGSCAFRHLNECRAWPPRPLADGKPVWPRIELDAWCGCWRAR
jgi:hypothetical protein